MLLQEREDRRTRPAAGVDARAYALRQHARDVAVEAAAGDVHDAVHLEIAHDVQHRLHVDACRREQRGGERSVQFWRRVAQVELAREDARVDHGAHQRVAVAVHARGREPDHDIAVGDRGTVDQLVALDHADAEADQFEFTLRIETGHARGLTAEQRAARATAAFRYAAQRFLAELRVELAHREVVEEHQRLGALHDDVVHHHRDAVDADRAEVPELRGELQLGADAIGARHQDRILVALGRLEEASEAADARQHFGPMRRARDLLDRIDEGFVAIEIDAGLGVGRRGLRRRRRLHSGIG